MNGEVNGTMDELMDTSTPNSPDNLQDHKNDASEGHADSINHCENSNNTENSDHLDEGTGQDPLANSNADHVENVDSNNIDGLTQMSTEVPEHDDSNHIFLDSHCINSNESYPESITSAKSEAMDQQRMDNIDVKTKDEVSEHEFTKHGNYENSDDEVDSEEDSSEEEGFEGEPKAEDTVSINSDSEPEGGDDSCQDLEIKNKSSDIVVVENQRSHSQNGNSHDSPSPEVHEIESDNDDCVVAEEIIDADNVSNTVQLRRSSRAIKKKRYIDDTENGDHGSDIEEVATITPISRKSKPIVIKDTKALVEMAAKQISSHQNPKKEPTIVIIDTNSLLSEKTTSNKNFGAASNTSINTLNLYQSIVARGTTVTPVNSKCTVSTQSAQNTQPSILPSLTDDMFVVEAPSFIVPYVYEKPSVKEFREFVDLLGKELDEQKAKADKELQEKENKEKEQQEKERQEKKERGEEVSDDEHVAASVPEAPEEGDEKKKKKKEKQKRNEDDDVSWDGESSADTDDEIMSDEEDKTIIIKDKVDAIDEIKDVTELTADKVCTSKSDNYFDCSLGKFFINIGLSLVQEYVQTDLLKHQTRKLNREKKAGHSTRITETSIGSLMKNLEFSKENNAPYSFKQKKCEFCSFKSESMLAMAHHLETPHMKNNVYKCNFCKFETRSPHDILYHMEAEHNISGKLERAPAYHQCANCPFEDNGKGKLARHLIPCAKKFKPDLNLSPPITWEPPAKIPKITKARSNMMGGSYQNAFNRSQMGNSSMGRGAMSIVPGMSAGYRPRARLPLAVPPRVGPIHGAPIIRGGAVIRHNTPVTIPSNYPLANNSKSKSVHQPSISITPLPRQPQPVQPQPTPHNKSTFVICEICDGYIKDLEQLRNHMQWIHKVKIHPKMIYNRPPLNCQKCQFRFFTDQGLERHLLGSHGLVTSSMQEAANKGKDAGRCPVCGRVYQWKLLNHVARDHSLTLKPAHLSYKCTVCTATFGMYKQFENHVYSAHSVVAKRVMDKSKTSVPAAKSTNDSLLKPLKINDEITIIPQPVKSAAPSTKDK